MKAQDLLIFGISLAVVLAIFSMTGFNEKVEVTGLEGGNLLYPAGEKFTLTFDAKPTSDKETVINSNSEKYPYSETWVDSSGNGKWDKGEKWTDTRNTKNKKWDKGEKFEDANENKKWDKGEKWTDTRNTKNGKYDKGEDFVDLLRGFGEVEVMNQTQNLRVKSVK